MIKLERIYMLLFIFSFITCSSCEDTQKEFSSELYKKSWREWEKLDYQNAIQSIESYISIASEQNEITALADAYYLKAFIFRSLNNPEEQLESLLTSKNYYTSIADIHKLASVNNDIGVLFNDYNSPDIAKKYLHNAILFSKKSGDDDILSYGYYNLGISLGKLGMNTDALMSFISSLDLELAMNRNESIGRIYLESGKLLFLSGNFEVANSYYIKALDIALAHDLKEIKAAANNNLGTIQFEYGNYTKAENYYNLALEYKEGKSYRLASTYNNIGILNLESKKFHRSAAFFKKSIESNHAIVDLDDLLTSFQELQALYNTSNAKDSMVYYANLQSELVVNLIRNKKVLNDINKSNQLRDLATKDIQAKQRQEESFIFYRNMGLVVILILLLAGVVWKMYYSYVSSLDTDSIANIHNKTLLKSTLNTIIVDSKNKDAVIKHMEVLQS